MADGFDIQALLQNPLFLAGTGALLAEPQDRFRGFLGGLQQGTNMQAQNQLNQLRQLQLKKAQDQMNFNPQNYMIPGQAVPADGAASPQEAVAAKPRLDMQSLLTGGLQNGYSPEQIAQIAGIMDPEAAAQRALAAKQTVVGPGQSIVNGSGQELFHNTNQPPNATITALNQAIAARDAAVPGTAQYNTYAQLVKHLSGEQSAEQNASNQAAIDQRAAENRDIRQTQIKQQNDQYLQNKTNQFSTQLQKTNLPQLNSALQDVETYFAKFPQGDIPGFGRMGSLYPDTMVSEEAQKARQAFAKLQNIDIRTNSGLNVTDQELKRDIKAVGSGVLMPTERIRQGIAQIRHSLDAQLRNAGAGVSDDVIDSYTNNGGDIDFAKYRPTRKGRNVSVDNASIDDIDAAIARKTGKK